MSGEISDSELQPVVTPRRKAREDYSRFLLNRAGVDPETAETFLNTRQQVLFDESPLSLIYTGRYEQGVAAVETFTEDLTGFDD